MPTPRVLRSKIRQVLQLLAGDAGLSVRQVGAALGVSKTTIGEIALYARDAGVDWPLASTLSDDELQARLYPPPRPRSTTRQEPDYAALHQELNRPATSPCDSCGRSTARAPGSGQRAYRYSAYCEKYRAWAKRLEHSMRQVHPGGSLLHRRQQLASETTWLSRQTLAKGSAMALLAGNPDGRGGLAPLPLAGRAGG